MNDESTGPLPEPTRDSEPYWQGLRERRLLLQRCAGCQTIRHYPRPVCAVCHSMDYDWLEASGRGTIHSWTVSHHAFHPAFRELVPYVLVTVDLEEGVRMQSRLIATSGSGAENDSTPEIGLPVEVVYEELTAEITVALFRPSLRPSGPLSAAESGPSPRP